MQKLKMIPCPRCNNPFPEKRKELGYFVCVNCSTTDKVVGITTVEGTGDHTWNDLVIMDGDEYENYLEREKGIITRSKKSKAEFNDTDSDDNMPKLEDEVSKYKLKEDPLA